MTGMDAYVASLEAEAAAVTAALDGVATTVEDREVTTTLRLAQTVEVTLSGDRYQIDTVRVKRWTAEDGHSYVEVEGYAYPLTKAGQRTTRKATIWRSLPRSLADVWASS